MEKLRVHNNQDRPFQAEDIKTILQGIDKILSIYSSIVKVTMNPPMIINSHISSDFGDKILKDMKQGIRRED